MEEKTSIEYSIEYPSCFIKLSGRISYVNNSGFSKFISAFLNNKKITEVLIDLTDCTYLDSTNLGLIAAISIGMTSKGEDKPKLVISTEDMREALCNVGFEKIFFLIESKSSDLSNLRYITTHDASEDEKKSEILQAHKTLLELNEKNREAFADVVKFMESEQI